MKDKIQFTFNGKGLEVGSPRKLDPRVIALVQFLARRTAERDFRAQLLTTTKPFGFEKEKEERQ